MLIIVVDGNGSDFLEDAFNDEAVGCFDIFEADCAEAGVEVTHNVDKIGRVGLIYTNVDCFNTAEPIE